MTGTSHGAPPRPLLSPSDLSLDLRKQKRIAKTLRDAVRDGDEDAMLRVKKHHPKSSKLDQQSFLLADAQLVVAKEAGVSSWPALKRHVEQMAAAAQAIEAQSDAPDGDLKTLHIRCGNDIENGLKQAGFCGDFLMFADPVCQGPIASNKDYFEKRAEFVASEYPGEGFSSNLDRLNAEYQSLSAAANYGRIVLWFEHDPYDQLLLVRVLSRLNATGADQRKVELVSLRGFPGISKFVGIGQLSPAALRHMFSQRIPVPDPAYQLASETWEALAARSPLELFNLSKRTMPLPFLPDAITRYLMELPSLQNGLSFTEQIALEILKDQAQPWSKVFKEFMSARDPLPYHGDLMFLGTLLRLRNAGTPALASAGNDFSHENWGETVFEITEIGNAMLSCRIDWTECAPVPRQHGGVTCFDHADWRWDTEQRQPVSCQSD